MGHHVPLHSGQLSLPVNPSHAHGTHRALPLATEKLQKDVAQQCFQGSDNRRQ